MCVYIYIYFIILFRSNSVSEKPEEESRNQMFPLSQVALSTALRNFFSKQTKGLESQIIRKDFVYVNSIKQYK